MSKDKDKVDDGTGCLTVIVVILALVYSCESRSRIETLEKRVDSLEHNSGVQYMRPVQ